MIIRRVMSLLRNGLVSSELVIVREGVDEWMAHSMLRLYVQKMIPMTFILLRKQTNKGGYAKLGKGWIS